jgi:hypothetical protein
MKLISLVVAIVAGAISIPFLALGAYGLWLYPGCLDEVGRIDSNLGYVCSHSNLVPGLVLFTVGLALLTVSILATIARRRRLGARAG